MEDFWSQQSYNQFKSLNKKGHLQATVWYWTGILKTNSQVEAALHRWKCKNTCLGNKLQCSTPETGLKEDLLCSFQIVPFFF